MLMNTSLFICTLFHSTDASAKWPCQQCVHLESLKHLLAANHYLLSVGCVLFSPFPTSSLISVVRASHKNLLMEPIYNSCSLSSPASFLIFGNLLMLFLPTHHLNLNNHCSSPVSLFLTLNSDLHSSLSEKMI